jgi:hypothetical protein
VTRSSSFNDLVELDGQGAELIASQLVKCIRNAGFTEEYLQQHWIYFVTDGAIVMLGKKSGVATRLRTLYPLLFSWHYMNKVTNRPGFPGTVPVLRCMSRCPERLRRDALYVPV